MKPGKLAAALAMIVIICVGTTNAEDAETPDRPVTPPAAKELAVTHNKFGIDIFKKLHKDGENTFISPTSIAICLQMARQGAGGNTRAEMDKAMHLEGIKVPEANQALIKELGGRDGVKLNIANSIWADPARLNLNQDYADEVITYFDSEARMADFSKAETLDAVNGWISDKTEEMIPEMLDEITSADVMFLINAIYFKGEWTTKFDKEETKEADWHNADGTTKKLNLMSRKDKIQYSEQDGHQVARLPYGEDEKSSMLIILPRSTDDLNELIESLDAEKLSKWSKSGRKRQGTIKLPRFEMKYKKQLKDQLMELGMKDAFHMGKADFTRMGESPMGPLYIGFVLHESRVIVNEEGTEAAAATITGIRSGSAPPPPFAMSCDRPFLFAIMDEPTGAVLFMGTVYQPEEPTR